MNNKENNYNENKFGEMVALVGGAMEYLEKYPSLDGYERYYIQNHEKRGCHFGWQKKADKVICRELGRNGISFYPFIMKTTYRYKGTPVNYVGKNLFYHFQYIVDYILKSDILMDITIKQILFPCKKYTEKEETKYEDCLHEILDWKYENIHEMATNISRVTEGKRSKASSLLKDFDKYDEFCTLKLRCREYHCNK